ncbi:MAG: regulatory, FmdB family domain protein [Herminiimonas sp.]|nr:regulatory, FmdB family domain protein [Herminiimonas sp.]
MPIYAYRCEDCGFAKDVLQKISDAPLKDCLACGKPTFKKQVTAAGFQLKGSGWYATDFRGGTSLKAPVADGKSGEAGGKSDTGSEKTATPAPATSGSKTSDSGSAPGPAPAAKAATAG